MIFVTLRRFLQHDHRAKGFTCEHDISKSNGRIALIITQLIYSPEVETFSFFIHCNVTAGCWPNMHFIILHVNDVTQS